jgi:hypothetical protein
VRFDRDEANLRQLCSHGVRVRLMGRFAQLQTKDAGEARQFADPVEPRGVERVDDRRYRDSDRHDTLSGNAQNAARRRA